MRYLNIDPTELESAYFDLGGEGNFSVTNTYSGRGMYGTQCWGITHSGNEALIALAITRGLISTKYMNGEDVDADDMIIQVADMIRSASRDNMGYDSITYFPGWQLEEEVDEDE